MVAVSTTERSGFKGGGRRVHVTARNPVGQEGRAGSAFSPLWILVHELRNDLSVLKGVREVHTPADSDLLVPTPDGFEVSTLYEGEDVEDE